MVLKGLIVLDYSKKKSICFLFLPIIGIFLFCFWLSCSCFPRFRVSFLFIYAIFLGGHFPNFRFVFLVKDFPPFLFLFGVVWLLTYGAFLTFLGRLVFVAILL